MGDATLFIWLPSLVYNWSVFACGVCVLFVGVVFPRACVRFLPLFPYSVHIVLAWFSVLSLFKYVSLVCVFVVRMSAVPLLLCFVCFVFLA